MTDDLAWVDPVQSYRIALAYFIGLERNDGTSTDIRETYDAEELLAGMAVVARRLRIELRHHSSHLGCSCGSDAWLEEERLRVAGLGAE